MTLPNYPGTQVSFDILLSLVQASAPLMVPEATLRFMDVIVHRQRCVPTFAHYVCCRKAPIGVGHALSCLTIQLTRVLALRTQVVPAGLALVCVCVCVCVKAAILQDRCLAACSFTPSSTFLRPDEIR